MPRAVIRARRASSRRRSASGAGAAGAPHARSQQSARAPGAARAAAMGSTGCVAVGQLNAAGTIDYDVIPPLLGTDGERHTPLSTNGYVIDAETAHPHAAGALAQALLGA